MIITKENARKLFLAEIRDMVECWEEESQRTSKGKLDGLAFSILALLDGSNPDFPAVDLVLRPHPGDKDSRQRQGRDFFEDGMVLNEGSEELHHLWHVEKAKV